MTVKLLGSDDVDNDANTGDDYFLLSKFTAEKSGNITEFKAKSDGNANIKYAIYADNAGEPGARLNCENIGQAIVSGWNTLAITSTAVVSGTDYWLALCVDTLYRGVHSDTGVRRYRVEEYDTWTFPNPAGVGFSSQTTFYDCVAGWGTEIKGRSFGFIIG